MARSPQRPLVLGLSGGTAPLRPPDPTDESRMLVWFDTNHDSAAALVREGTVLAAVESAVRLHQMHVHERAVDTFRIDRHAVTNEEFAAFVDDTGYSTVAERELDPAGFPGANPVDLVPGSMVFTPTAGPVDLGIDLCGR